MQPQRTSQCRMHKTEQQAAASVALRVVHFAFYILHFALPCREPYTSRRPSIALFIVTSSAYSRSLPTGTPIAMRVTRTPSGLSSRAR